MKLSSHDQERILNIMRKTPDTQSKRRDISLNGSKQVYGQRNMGTTSHKSNLDNKKPDDLLIYQGNASQMMT